MAADARAWLAVADLPARWRGRRHFSLLDADFGDGSRFLRAWTAWRTDPTRCGRLHVVAFLPPERASAPPTTSDGDVPADCVEALRAAWPPALPGLHRMAFDDGRVVLSLHRRRVSREAARLRHDADLLLLPRSDDPDAASPAFLRALARVAAPGARLIAERGDPASEAALRAALRTAGFASEDAPPDVPLLTARHAPAFAPRQRPASAPVGRAFPGPREAVVVGAGLAGSAAAARLARAGWRVTVLERAPRPAAAASGNLAGSFHPHVSRDDCALSRLSRAALAVTLEEWERIGALRDGLAEAGGLLQLAADATEAAGFRAIADTPAAAAASLRLSGTTEAGRLAGLPFDEGAVPLALHFERAGWARPAALCERWLHAPGLRLRTGAPVAALSRDPDGAWRLLDADGGPIAAAPVVVLACGDDATRLGASAGASTLPLARTHGQVTHLDARFAPCMAITGAGYLLPAVDGTVVAGATFGATETDAHRANVLRQAALLRPGSAEAAAWEAIADAPLAGRAAWRCAAPDRLPVAGALVDEAARRAAPPLPAPALPRLPGLFALTGYGSRGLLWAPLMAELLACTLEGEPPPLDASLIDAIDPARFARRGACTDSVDGIP